MTASCCLSSLFSKLESRCTLTRQFSFKVAHEDSDKKKITAIYCVWMVDNKQGSECNEKRKL